MSEATSGEDRGTAERFIARTSRQCRDTMALVSRSRASLDQNVYMYPKPLPSFNHLRPLDTDTAAYEEGSDDRGIVSGSGNGSEYLGLPSLVSSSSMSSEAASGAGAVPFDASILQSRVLGKRGRLYDEVWDEGDYLEKKSALIALCNSSSHVIPFRTEVVGNWSQILNHYRDDHDGVYVDWLLDKAHERCKQRQIQEVYTLKKEGERIQSALQNAEEVLHVFAPPVPVSCQHPASWGLHTRRRGTVPSTALRDPSMGLGLGLAWGGAGRGRSARVAAAAAAWERGIERETPQAWAWAWSPRCGILPRTPPRRCCRWPSAVLRRGRGTGTNLLTILLFLFLLLFFLCLLLLLWAPPLPCPPLWRPDALRLCL